MKIARSLLPILMVSYWLGAGHSQTPTPTITPSPIPSPLPSQEQKSLLPFSLDLSPYFTKVYVEPDGYDSKMVGYTGRKMIDGLPFDINGECLLWGKSSADRGTIYTNQILGIKIDRAFEELHMVHFAQWREYYGCSIATIRLHYSDGTHHDFQIRYNFQVIDWVRLLPEEQEILNDPDTKIILRGGGPFDCSSRLFTSVFHNPFPTLKVDSMDIISTKSSASYDLIAATVSNSDPNREVTPALPKVPSRKFNGRFRIHVVDAKTGAPVSGAEAYPYMTIDDYGLVADPILTAEDGTVTIKYPTSKTTEMDVTIEKEGYNTFEKEWQKGTIPYDLTVSLTPKKIEPISTSF